jgi:mevalonate kinase
LSLSYIFPELPFMVEVSASAKVILVGEHAVVYGQPAIAVPVSDLRVHASVRANDPVGQGLRFISVDTQKVFTPDTVSDNALAVTARLVLQALNAPPPDVLITIRSDIPVASGLGSGAAVSTAIARALFAVLNRSLENEALNTIVFETEKIHHGTPSGIDNAVVVYEQPVYFVPGQPIVRLTIGRPMSVLIANTGLRASTRVAVSDVRELYNSSPRLIQPIIEAIGVLVKDARQAIEIGDIPLLGNLMERNHTLLQQLTVSCPELDELVLAAMSAGALGAKLSGSGRGGNMIALVRPETTSLVEGALLEAGAVSVFATTVQ